MSKKDLRLKINELSSSIGVFKGLDIQVGRIVDEEWEEPMGPTPMPGVSTLRDWDRKLLKRYKPFYMPFCDLCCLCTFGKCDLTGDKKGACGLTMAGQQSRIVMLACCIGASTHAAHGRHMLEHLIEQYGRDYPLDVALNTTVEAPHVRLVCGIKPRTLRDLEDALDYVETQIVQLVAAAHTGQEGDNIDFESKAFHAGMLDHVALEVADIMQIATLGFPKGDPEAPMAEVGYGTIDPQKPVIMCIGHNVLPSVDIIDYMMDNNLFGEVEVGGLCCTAHDMSRYNKRSKIVGPISWQLKFIKAGIPDLIVVDEQCIRTDVMDHAKEIGVPVIAASEKSCLGLPDRTHDPVNAIIDDLVSGREPGVLLIEPDKVGEVAVKTAIEVRKRRGEKKLFNIGEISELAAKCRACMECVRACPNTLPVMDAMTAAKEGDYSLLAGLNDLCVGCGRCESACPVDLPVINMIAKASEDNLLTEKYAIRVGRGAIQDVEIREVGSPIVFGEIPGVVALVGCANYPAGYGDVAAIAEEFLKRRFIVVTSGCSAMNIAMTKDEDGLNLYEKYPGNFDAGGLVNVGSCVANAHITGAAIKIANIFAKRPLRANYEEIADYIHNRVGAVGIAWGAMSQKAAAIAAGCWRLGIPVIVGPHGSKYRRMLLGDKTNEDDWKIYNARDGEKVYVGPVPEHLFYAAETLEEALVLTAKLAMRPNDTNKGRAVKLSHYIDLHKKHYGAMPDDLHLFVRRAQDVPFTMKDEIMKILEAKGWEEDRIASPDPTLLDRMVRRRG
ncbi:MAG TPA: CO dehydrogenase/acetyl-CoA synthase complex subunit alpha [Candidatus Krumholzibacteriaceae bacterium]|nr:CO dehydrogenase/acetyl-CoA synthase complex subunit alpha [Candidatus Krumholzibacteriaceae bacterium]